MGIFFTLGRLTCSNKSVREFSLTSGDFSLSSGTFEGWKSGGVIMTDNFSFFFLPFSLFFFLPRGDRDDRDGKVPLSDEVFNQQSSSCIKFLYI